MTRALTIAHVLASFGMGGAERVALDLAIMQKRYGHRVLTVSLSGDPEGPLGQEFREAGIVVRTVPKRPGIDLTLTARIALAVRGDRLDIVHTHNTIPLIYAAPAGRLWRTGVIHTKHGEGHLETRGGKVLRRVVSPCLHSFVAVSETTAAQARAQFDYPLPSRIRVIDNGIRLDRHHPDLQARREIREELGIPENAWVVGTVGRFDDNKNQSALIRAAGPLLAEDFHLVLVGDGPSMDKVKAAAAASPRPDSVHITGRRPDAYRVMAAYDVFALPSLSEGLPLVLPEAMATGLPVISTSAGGIPKVVMDGETGLLVRPGDDAALGECLAVLYRDRKRAVAMGAAGLQRALVEYSADRMAREYMELYLRAAD
ncbi:MAG: glycosyltransferase [Myxococcota bacterium]